ncbi:MAG: TPM domain-containing protein [Prevotellaceae bacterium]|jgi:uncharacterized protein|nr:TPM domain-containing protein [Prevotellaceae bacterium]
MKFLKYFVFVMLFLMVAIKNFAYNLEIVPNPKMANAQNFVSNPDKILNVETENQLNTILQNLEKETTVEVAVVVLNSIKSNNIENFGVELFEHWKIGKKDKDNGLLMLFVLDIKKIRFEVGYGLEGILPDAICKRIQTKKILPEFKNGNYDAGILAGVESIAEIIKNEGKIGDNSLNSSEKTNLTGWLFFYGFMIIFQLWLIIQKAQKIKNNSTLQNNRDRFFAMQKGKNTIISFVSISTIIAAAVEFFLLFYEIINLSFFFLTLLIFLTIIPVAIFGKIRANKFRRQKVFCNKCNSKMTLLDEQIDDVYLSKKQCFEEYIKSVDYDVFLCNNCQNNIIFAYEKHGYLKCPKCNAKAYSSIKKNIAIHPTTFHSGREDETFYCKFCAYTEVRSKTLPRYSNSRGVVGGGLAGRNFGGGSFGGGRSGGGGATSGW